MISATRLPQAILPQADPAYSPALGRDPGGGLLPRSIAFWGLAGYLTLFIIRPWEKIWPWLGAVPVERICALGALGAIALAGRLQFRLNAQSLTVLGFLAAITLS